MKTLRDIIDFVWEFLELCELDACEGCSKYNWCYVDTYLLVIDYLYNGVC